jgi:hypothetical protein
VRVKVSVFLLHIAIIGQQRNVTEYILNEVYRKLGSRYYHNHHHNP